MFLKRYDSKRVRGWGSVNDMIPWGLGGRERSVAGAPSPPPPLPCFCKGLTRQGLEVGMTRYNVNIVVDTRRMELLRPRRPALHHLRLLPAAPLRSREISPVGRNDGHGAGKRKEGKSWARSDRVEFLAPVQRRRRAEGATGLVKERRRVILVPVFSAARETARTWSPRSPTKAMSSSEMRESRRASGSFLGPLSWGANSGLKRSRY